MNPLPALKDLAYDRGISETDKALYLLLVFELDLVVYREVKQRGAAAALGLDHSTVGRSLDRLVAANYIERLVLNTKQIQYRLVYSRQRAFQKPADPIAA